MQCTEIKGIICDFARRALVAMLVVKATSLRMCRSKPSEQCYENEVEA